MLLIFKRYFLAVSLIFVSLYPRSGQLNVGFDIDDTVLFSRDVFLNIPKDKRNPIDYGWVNTHDDGMSIYIDPTVKLINYFISNGHNVLFITARSGENGEALATFLSEGLGHSIKKDMNLFFAPSEEINGKNHTTKHRIMRNDSSISQYGPNYFGNTLNGRTKKNPYNREDLNTFYSGSVGMFGESIYPIIWKGPNEE